MKVLANTIHSAYFPLSANDKLSKAVELFAKGVHRIPIVDDTNGILNIFTQSQFLKFLVEHEELFGALASVSAMDLNLGVSEAKHNEIYRVNETTPAIDAIQMLYDKRLSAVAVVDAEGLLVSQFSATDLRGLSPSLMAPFNFRRLNEPIKEVIDIIRKETKQTKNFLVWCLPGSTLFNIAKHIHANRVHRVYLIDNYTKLYGVISITDIAKLFKERVQQTP